jgi:hypothetical protein
VAAAIHATSRRATGLLRAEDDVMADIMLVGFTVVLLGVALLYVTACERLKVKKNDD